EDAGDAAAPRRGVDRPDRLGAGGRPPPFAGSRLRPPPGQAAGTRRPDPAAQPLRTRLDVVLLGRKPLASGGASAPRVPKVFDRAKRLLKRTASPGTRRGYSFY